MIRHLGYACINQTLNKKVLTSRTLRLSNFDLDKVSNLILLNCKDLLTILQWNNKNNIKFFRISSNLFPFFDHPDKKYKLESLKDYKEIIYWLEQSGKFAKENDMKLEMHPCQYTVLASTSEDIVNKSIDSLEMHNYIADLLGFKEEFKINIHVGTAQEGLENSAKRFCNNFKRLSDSLKGRLTVENDDKGSMFDVESLYKLIYCNIGIPICFDFHHWRFCNTNTMKESLELSLSTWKETPTTHYSESKDFLSPNPSHSDYLEEIIPEYHLEYDVMIEAKAKELALMKYRNKLKILES
jgi:UV DNA damage endonuclease